MILDAVTIEILSVPLTFPTFDVAVTFAFNSSFETGSFWFTSISVAETSYSSLNLLTFTVTSTVFLLPSGYVTSTTPVLVPGDVTIGGVFHVAFVPSGNPALSTLEFASGISPLRVCCGISLGIFFVLIEETVIFADLSLTFPTLSSARIFKINSLLGVFSGSLSTSCFPDLNLIECVALSYSK